MGVSKASEREMMLAMVDAYNSPRDEWDHKELARIKAGNGGALPSKYDESSGEFPLQLNDFQEILDAPAYKIDDTTRKGGFVADSPSRLDTKKIEALR
jgi:hypothetical protein